MDASPDDLRDVYLTEEGRRLLAARVRELRDQASTLLKTLEEHAGDTWTVTEHQRAVDELDRLTSALDEARAVEEVPDDPRVVLLGDTVRIDLGDGTTESYIVVHPLEARVEDQRISSESPLGRALLGRRVGEDIEVAAPSASYRCTIVSAEREAAD